MANYRPVEPRLYEQLKDVLAAKRERENLMVLEPQNEDEFHHEYVTIEATSSNLPHPNARKMPSAPPTTPESEFEQKFIQISRESKRMLREMAEKSEILISKFTKSHHILDLEKSAENDFSSAVQTSQIEIEHFAELLNNKLEMIVASESPELYPVEEWDDFLAEMSDFLKDKASVDAQQEKLWEKRENLLENQRKLMERQKYVYNKMMQIFNEAQKMELINNLQTSLDQLNVIRSSDRMSTESDSQ